MKRLCFALAGVALALVSASARADCRTSSCQKVIDNGSDATRKTLVVLGDGYAAGDQARWRSDVETLVTNGVFGNDFFKEIQNAFNVYRVDLVSVASGVSQRRYDERGTPDDGSDDVILSTTYRNTSLGYLFSGSWAHSWMEGQAFTGSRIATALSTHVTRADYVLIMLNESGYGGHAGGNTQVVTSGSHWTVVAHEYGHGIGGLGDEYFNRAETYTGSAINGPNCSTVVNRSDVFWNRFVAPATALPTLFSPATMDSNRTVGMFEGCGTLARGIYRPVDNCRMRSNSPHFCPVCYTRMKGALHPYTQQTFDRAVSGDFTGDGRSDLLVHNGQDLALFRTTATGRALDDAASILNNVVPPAAGGTTWQPAANDQYFVADFNGDGYDDVYVFNGSDWSTPYLGMLRSNGTSLEGVATYGGSIPSAWTMRPGDKLYVGDFDADGREDLALFNGADWSTPYFIVLRSTGTALTRVALYTTNLPGWQMTAGDQYRVGDFDADGRSDLYVFNGSNWSIPYLGMIRATGTALAGVRVYSTSLPGWTMSSGDQLHVGDFDADGRADAYVFNGSNWGSTYLLMARSTGTELAYVRRYDSASAPLPGWALRPGDQLSVADANRDGRADLVAFNPARDWSTEYLGTFVSSGSALSGTWSADWVGGWNLGTTDKLLVSDFSGTSHSKGDLFIRNTSWLGMLRSTPSGFVLDRSYPLWIYNPLHDARPWSTTLP